jgi:ubiquinone/menaquinone biosynthesis C-methylase UbiE
MFSRLFARQLASPSGPAAGLLARVWNRRNAALNDAALRALALVPDDRVLEVGFGGGYLLGRMARQVTAGHLVGVDVSPAIVARGTRRFRTLVAAGRLGLRCAPAEALPFPAGRFTKACSVNSLFYWADVPRALAELARVLEPGGLLVLCFTRGRCLEDKSFARHGVGCYEEADVRRFLETAGFHTIAASPGADRHREFVCLSGCRQPITL